MCLFVYFQTLNMNIKDISIAFILKFLLIMEKAVKKYTLILVPGLNGMGLFINLAKFVSLDWQWISHAGLCQKKKKKHFIRLICLYVWERERRGRERQTKSERQSLYVEVKWFVGGTIYRFFPSTLWV